MIGALMSNSLNTIMVTLQDGIDSQFNIKNASAIEEAVSSLELFPMTTAHLHETRIGKLLKNIRPKVDVRLRERITLVVKAWQQLIQPGSNVLHVIPLKTSSRLAHPPASNAKYQPPTSADASARHDSGLSRTKSFHALSSSSPQPAASTPASRKRPNSNVSSPTQPASPISANPEGRRSKQPKLHASHLANGKTPASPLVADAPVPARPLAKVKSTAELLRSAGDIIDQATAERILIESAQKQPAEERHVVHSPPPPPARPSTTNRKSSISMTTSHSVSPSTRRPQAKPTALQLGLEAMREPSPPVPTIQKAEVPAQPTEEETAEERRARKKEKKRFETPPVTNRMDQWPQLPPLPAQIDWGSLDREEPMDEQHLRPLEVFSMDLGQQTLHVLPWVDVYDEQKRFFPGAEEQSLDELITSVAEPW